jgi:hypothetical protein|tara:strand:- start:308 stop:937 length:630 start_codon:yes stop_codon:yes gene_type:complete
MDLKTYILPGYKITTGEGIWKSVEAVEEDIDEVQTYDMDSSNFDAASIHLNTQTLTKVPPIQEVQIKTEDLVKIEFEDDDLYNFGNVFVINKDCAVMGGRNLGWLVGDLQSIIEDQAEDSTSHLMEMYTQMEAGQYVCVDLEKDLKEKKIVSIGKIESDEEEQTVYWIDQLTDGDSIFVNDIMVGVRRPSDWISSYTGSAEPEVGEEDE